MVMVLCSFENHFAAFSPGCDNVFNVLPLAARKPWNEFLMVHNEP